MHHAEGIHSPTEGTPYRMDLTNDVMRTCSQFKL